MSDEHHNRLSIQKVEIIKLLSAENAINQWMKRRNKNSLNPLNYQSFSILNEAKYRLIYHQGALWVVEQPPRQSRHVDPDII